MFKQDPEDSFRQFVETEIPQEDKDAFRGYLQQRNVIDDIAKVLIDLYDSNSEEYPATTDDAKKYMS